MTSCSHIRKRQSELLEHGVHSVEIHMVFAFLKKNKGGKKPWALEMKMSIPHAEPYSRKMSEPTETHVLLQSGVEAVVPKGRRQGIMRALVACRLLSSGSSTVEAC